jgi:hypothetical protein
MTHHADVGFANVGAYGRAGFMLGIASDAARLALTKCVGLVFGVVVSVHRVPYRTVAFLGFAKARPIGKGMTRENVVYGFTPLWHFRLQPKKRRSPR